MPDLGVVFGHWGYGAIFAAVVLGNLGLPVPKESILALAGYAVWRGDLSLAAVLGVGVRGCHRGDHRIPCHSQLPPRTPWRSLAPTIARGRRGRCVGVGSPWKLRPEPSSLSPGSHGRTQSLR